MTTTAFDSDTEMWDELRADMAAADAQVGPDAVQYKPGVYFVRFVPEYSLLLYGQILDSVEHLRANGGDEEDLEYEREVRSDPAMRHYRFTKMYSVHNPDGLLGDQHVSTLTSVLTPEEFERAKRLGWPTSPREFFNKVLRVRIPAEIGQA